MQREIENPGQEAGLCYSIDMLRFLSNQATCG